ncbi:hypothetical protein ACFWN1_16950 [Streptomyces sp. NPDC058459]|uniref:hypothetical protein n=1 Tax=Streptomyces sp. NPDC058459 TaxID=3346508 RepID=UPI003657FCA2
MRGAARRPGTDPGHVAGPYAGADGVEEEQLGVLRADALVDRDADADVVAVADRGDRAGVDTKPGRQAGGQPRSASSVRRCPSRRPSNADPGTRLAPLKQLAAMVPPPGAAPASPARLVYTDEDGQAVGSALVREITVGRPPGTVTYRVEGPRLAGSVVVGPYRHSHDPVPTGISVQYGTSAGAGHHRDDEPVVNGVRLRGGWDHSSAGPVTPSSPPTLPRPSRAEEPFSQPVPDATKNRWWAVVRALAAHYSERPDNLALRQAAARARAPQALDATRQTLDKLTEEKTRLTATVNRLREHLNGALALLP